MRQVVPLFLSLSLFQAKQKTALLLGCVRPTQCLLYNSIESYSTHELLKIRARIAERSNATRRDATRRWESECNTTTAAATAVTATATATAVRILHTYKASAAAAAAVQPAATTATVAVAVAAVQSASICVDHL